MSQKGKLEAKAINLKPSQLEIPFVLQTKSDAKRRNSADLHKFIYLFCHENRKWMTTFTMCTVSFSLFSFFSSRNCFVIKMWHYLFGHFNHHCSRKAFSVAVDKLFMGTFPHNFTLPRRRHKRHEIMEEKTSRSKRSYGFSKRIIQLSYYCGADTIQYVGHW